MTETNPSRTEHTDSIVPDFYLPAVAVPSGVDLLERLLGDRFGRHGVVRIPENYGR